MNPNINAVILQIDGRIVQLTDLRARLIKFAGEEGAAAPVQTPGTAALVPDEVSTAQRKKNRQKFQKHRAAVEKRNGGGRMAKAEGTMQKEEQPGAPTVPSVPRGVNVTTGKVSTVAGAMKREIVGLEGKEFTAEALRTALDAKYGGEDWWQNASSSALSGNLSYWSSKGRLEKTAGGYKAKDAEFFEDTQY